MLPFLPLLGLAPLISAAPTSGRFNILSFNVAGLPAILNSNGVPGDKTTNTAIIGQKFAASNIDLIQVQEDFNYHATLYENDNHPYRTATSGGVPIGSGLNTLSNFEWVDFDRVKWEKCSDIAAADCLTPKGFTFMRVKISEGVWVDAYNIHTDASATAIDKWARRSNMEQVSEYITKNSYGNPVLVFGDSNSLYTREGDVPTIFRTEQNMTDVWIELIRHGVEPTPGSDVTQCNDAEVPSSTECETLDKVWYRGSSLMDLKATMFQYATKTFLQPDGSVLSDHNPIQVDFEWGLSEKYRMSDYWGGPHGDFFNDMPALDAVAAPAVKSVTIRGANRVDAVSITLTNGQTFTHGGTGGTAYNLTLADGETVTEVELCQAKYETATKSHTRIFFMSVKTSAGNTISAGVRTEECVTRTAESGWGVVGFVGRSGDEVDRLGLIYGKH
ncbi:mannose-binding lectin [Delitschia confertaspora ATCC 74209]|uniref:Mannose-binding lectin n=1 Tax=Delitschia confertaspora ATCC 74209 TaxID=1513339 RepID=A0A9P4JJN4_9PLEO|nr:mannose-binding lectin [Delitschia confertaspora ATCC 74209]